MGRNGGGGRTSRIVCVSALVLSARPRINSSGNRRDEQHGDDDSTSRPTPFVIRHSDLVRHSHFVISFGIAIA
jgi:hypothetical protein